MTTALLWVSFTVQAICAVGSLGLALDIPQPDVVGRWPWFIVACLFAMGAVGSINSGLERLNRGARS